MINCLFDDERKAVAIITSILFAMTLFADSEKILLTALLIGFFLSITFFSLIEKKQIKISYYSIWFISFHLVLFIYAIYSPYVGYESFTGYSVKFHTIQILSTIILIYWLNNSKEKKWDVLLKVSFYDTILIGAYVSFFEREMLSLNIRKYLVGTTGYRLGDGNGWNSNSLSVPMAFFAVIIIIGLEINKIESDRKKYAYLLLAFQILFVFFSGSKKGLIIIGVSFLYRVFLKAKKGKKLIAIVSSIIIFIVVIYLMFENELLYNIIGVRIEGMLSTMGLITSSRIIRDISTIERLGMLQKAGELFSQHPFWGNGLNSFAVKSGYGIYSHNSFSEIAVSMGLFGLSIYIFIYIKIFIAIMRNKTVLEKKINLLMLGCALFIDLTSATFYGNVMVYMFLLVASMNCDNKITCK